MNKSRKRGITLSSLVIYILLFTGFTVFVASISNNMIERLFTSRGEAINYSSLNKLQYNIENSAMLSDDVTLALNKIAYSNGDIYLYDPDNKIITKNGGILCSNVEIVNASIETATDVKKITVEIKLSKYLNVMTRTVISCVEG